MSPNKMYTCKFAAVIKYLKIYIAGTGHLKLIWKLTIDTPLIIKFIFLLPTIIIISPMD